MVTPILTVETVETITTVVMVTLEEVTRTMTVRDTTNTGTKEVTLVSKDVYLSVLRPY